VTQEWRKSDARVAQRLSSLFLPHRVGAVVGVLSSPSLHSRLSSVRLYMDSPSHAPEPPSQDAARLSATAGAYLPGRERTRGACRLSCTIFQSSSVRVVWGCLGRACRLLPNCSRHACGAQRDSRDHHCGVRFFFSDRLDRWNVPTRRQVQRFIPALRFPWPASVAPGQPSMRTAGAG
jgi:hypothetical protein